MARIANEIDPSPDIRETWRRFAESKDAGALAFLYHHYEGVAARVVSTLMRPFRSNFLIYRDVFFEMESVGRLSLLQCLHKFDPTRPIPFGVYAWYQARRDVGIALRGINGLPLNRRAITARNHAKEAHREMEAELGRPVSEGEFFGATGMRGNPCVFHLGQMGPMRRDRSGQQEFYAPAPVKPAMESAALQEALYGGEDWSARDRQIFRLHAYEGRSIEETGAMLDKPVQGPCVYSNAKRLLKGLGLEKRRTKIHAPAPESANPDRHRSNRYRLLKTRPRVGLSARLGAA